MIQAVISMAFRENYLKAWFFIGVLCAHSLSAIGQLSMEFARQADTQPAEIARQIERELVAADDPVLQNKVLWDAYDVLSEETSYRTTHQVFQQLIGELNGDFDPLKSEIYLVLGSNLVENSEVVDYLKLEQYIRQAVALREDMPECDLIRFKFEGPMLYVKAPNPNYEAARILIEQHIAEAETLECHEPILFGMILLAERIYEHQGLMVKSLQIKRNALALADSLQVDDRLKAFVNVKLGHLYSYMENYRAAITHYTIAERLFQHASKKDFKVVSNMNNIGICYTKLSEQESALNAFEKALSYAETYDLEPWRREAWRGIISGNIGDMYFWEGDYQKAIPLLEKDIALSAANGAFQSQMISLNRLGIGLIHTGKVAQGKAMLDSGSSLFQLHEREFYRAGFPLKRLEVWLDNLQGNIVYHRSLGKYQEAFQLMETYNQVNDSLHTIKRQQSLSWVDAQLQLAAQEKENKELRSEIRQQNYLLYLGTGIIATLVLTIVLAWKYYQSLLEVRSATSKRLKAELREQQEKQRHKDAEESAQAEIKELERQRLEEELAFKQRELATYTQRLVEKNSLLHKIVDQMEQQPHKNELQGLVESIKKEIAQDVDWEHYKRIFEEVHPHFFERLQNDYPQLTQNDLRYAAYVKMGLSTKEIATMMNVNAESLKNTRYRMRKKISLPSEMKINDFILKY